MKVLVVRILMKNPVFRVIFADTFLATFSTYSSPAVKNKQLEQIVWHLYKQVKGNTYSVIVTGIRSPKKANETKIAFKIGDTKYTHSFVLQESTAPIYCSLQHFELLAPFPNEQGRLVEILNSGLISEFDYLVTEKGKCLDLLSELESHQDSLSLDAKDLLATFIAKQRVEINNLFLLTNDNDCADEAIKNCLLQANIDSFAKKAMLVALYNMAAQLYNNYVVETGEEDEKRNAFFQYFYPFGFVSEDKKLLPFDQVRGNKAVREPETDFQKWVSGQASNSNFIGSINRLLGKIDSIKWDSWILSSPMRPSFEEALVKAIHDVNAQVKAYSNICSFGIAENTNTQELTRQLEERKRKTTYVLNEADIKKYFAQIKLAFAACAERCNGELLAILKARSMPSSSASSLASSSVASQDETTVPLSQSSVSVSLSSSSDTVESSPASLSESSVNNDESNEDFMDNFKLHFLASTWAKKGGSGLNLVIANESDDASLPDSIKRIKAVLDNVPVEQQWGAIKQIAQQANAKASISRCPTTSAYLALLAGNDDEMIQDYFKLQARILRDEKALRNLLQQIKQVIEQRHWIKPAGSFYPIQVDTDNGVEIKYVPKHIAKQHDILRDYFVKPETIAEADTLSVLQQIEKIGLKASHNTHRYRHEHVSNFYSIFSQAKSSLPVLLAEQQDYIDRNKNCFNALGALYDRIKETTWVIHSWRSIVKNTLNGSQNLNQGDRLVCLNSDGTEGVENKPDFLPNGVKEQYFLIDALIKNKSEYDALTVFAKVQEIARKAGQKTNKYRLAATSDFYNEILAIQTPEDLQARFTTI